MSSRRSGRASGVSRDAPSSPGDSHLSLTVKVPSNKLRDVTRGSNRRSDQFVGGEIVEGKRNRGVKKSYVVDSSPDDDDEEEEEEAEIEVEEEDDDDDLEEADEDAEGEDEMEIDVEEEDVDAEGEEDAEGDIDMDLAPPPPTIKVSRPPPKSKPAPRPSASKVIQDDDDDDDDLSDPDSDMGDQTLGFGDETMADEDAEGEEIEVAGEEIDEEEEEEEADSDDEGSQEDTPDLTKMTKRQRARFDDGPGDYMKLSDEVQVKKHFTAEELSMRRQEMARRRRNLSEKRNEEVKMETINKLLKKQAPKINKKALAAQANADDPDHESNKANPVFVRWISNKNGNHIAVPEEMLQSPAGKVFMNGGLASGKMIEEVA
ncbi:Fc.00g031070.m01.CDS01 [Cosmosporella sp. VM-42]